MNKDISIEYAHIYTNRKIDEEQRLSLSILKDIEAECQKNNQTFSLVVMVDDYSFPDPEFDYDEFTAWLGTQGFAPDLLFRESQLIPTCDEVIEHIQDKDLREDIVDYVKSKKYPCSLFIAAWYLLRLGHLKSSLISSELIANKLINILPESFKPFEDKGLEIIESTKFAEAVQAIEHRYFKGRLIA